MRSFVIQTPLLAIATVAVTAAYGADQRIEFGFTADAVPSTPPAYALRSLAVCQDGTWENGEFCARDAYLATGAAEFNHDCYVDILDFRLLGRYWMTFGDQDNPGDIDGDGDVWIVDLGLFQQAVWMDACPGTPSGMAPDACAGDVWLSFSNDPGMPENGTVLVPATPDTIYLFVSGYTDAAGFELGVRTSDNVQILAHQLVMPHFEGWGVLDPDPQHSYRAIVRTGDDVFAPSPQLYSRIVYWVTDSEPAWVKLDGFQVLDGVPTRLRWFGIEADHSVDFENVTNVGINGPPPPGTSTCGFSLGNPCGTGPVPVPIGFVTFLVGSAAAAAVGVGALARRRGIR